MNEDAKAETESPGSCLKFNNVWFQYDSEPAIEDLSFDVESGGFVAILGPNGSGKTTLLRLALGLVKPTRGTVTLFGQTPDTADARKRVGYVPQTMEGVNSHSPATSEEVVVQGLYRGFDPGAFFRRSGQKRVVRALELAGVADIRNKRVASLSVGQQQRTLIARALVRDPDLLVLDEPVAGMDAAGQEQLYSMLRRLNRAQGITILMVTHDIMAVLREATTVACINRSLVFHGPPHRLTEKEFSELYGLPMDVLIHDVLHEHR